MNKMNFEQIHDCEIEMLKLFVTICEKHNLNYYLAGGTLLGAVRHHGFIPWDDDIDILMTRDDYDRFLTYADEIAESGRYFIASCELGNLNMPFCRIFDRKTHILSLHSKDSFEQNLWVDILPLDGLPDDDRIVEKLFKKSLFWRMILKIQKARPEKSKTFLKRICKYVIKFITLPWGPKTTAGIINKISRTYSVDSCNYIGGIAMGYGPQEKMPKEEYLKTVKVEFEGMLLNAPSCWDYYLTRLYGDYMQLPPEDQRIAHPIEASMDD